MRQVDVRAQGEAWRDVIVLKQALVGVRGGGAQVLWPGWEEGDDVGERLGDDRVSVRGGVDELAEVSPARRVGRSRQNAPDFAKQVIHALGVPLAA